MANEVLIGFAYASGVGFGAGNTDRSNIFGGASDATTTAEADFSAPLKAGTLSKLRAYVTASGGSAVSTITSRINAGAGSQTITQTTGTTGEYEDLTHSDSITDGQLIDIQNVGVGGVTTISVSTMVYAGTAAVTASYGTGQLAWSDTAITGNSFLRGQGLTSANTAMSAEADAQIKIRAAGTVSNLRAVLSTNAGGNPTTTIVTRDGGMSGSGTVSFTGGTTGAQTDATHSDSVASADLFCYLASSGGTSRTITYRQCSVLFVSSGSTFDINTGFGSNAGTNNGSAAAAYNTIFGRLVTGAQATEANAQARVRFATTLTNLRIYLSSSAASNGAIVTFRDGGSSGQSTISSTLATTGWFEDVSHSDSIASGDLVNYSTVGAGSNTSYLLADVGAMLGASAVSVNAPQASATGSANAVTPEIDVPVTGASATGSAGTVVPSDGGVAAGASATGSAHSPVVEIDVALAGVSAQGAANNVGVSAGGSVQPSGVFATGAANPPGFEIDESPHAPQVSATAAANPVVPQISIKGGQATAFAEANPVEAHVAPHGDFPIISIMRNTPVPAIGAMSNTPVAMVGKLHPSGPEPASVAVFIVGAYAIAAAINVTPFRNVLINVAGVSAQGAANDCAGVVS